MDAPKPPSPPLVEVYNPAMGLEPRLPPPLSLSSMRSEEPSGSSSSDMRPPTWREFLARPSTRQTFLFSLIGLFLNADQNLMGPNLTQIAREFNMSNEERDLYLGGIIAVGFYVIGGITAIAVGYLADKVNRRNLFCVVVFIGACVCVCARPAARSSRGAGTPLPRRTVVLDDVGRD
jgi:hypothetical protein